MSRSVTMNYDRLRNPKQAEEKIAFHVGLGFVIASEAEEVES